MAERSVEQILDELLAEHDAQSSMAARAAVVGFEASLRAIAKLSSGAPARLCTQLADRLAGLLAAHGGPAGPSRPAARGRAAAADGPTPQPDAKRSPTPRPGSVDAVVADALSAELREALGRYSVPLPDTALWQAINLALLRLPETIARRLQDQLTSELCARGAQRDDDAVTALSSRTERLLFPGLVVNGARAPGLRASPEAGLRGEVEERLGAGLDQPWLRALGAYVSACLVRIDLDGTLHHAFEGLVRNGSVTLSDGDERRRFTAELLLRLERVAGASDDARERIRNLLDLDEAIHSLVHEPPAERDSWWSKLQGEARLEILKAVREEAASSGLKVWTKVLAGRNAPALDRAKNSFQVTVGGRAGEVSACLRVYADIEGTRYPGRVIYR